MQNYKEFMNFENVGSRSWILSPAAQNDIMASVGQLGRVPSAPRNDVNLSLLPWMGEGGAKRRMRVKISEPLTRISSFRRAQAEIQPSTLGCASDYNITSFASSRVLLASHLGRGKCAAFTLAEVLITLGIIGVVAAMTLPALIQNKVEKDTVVRVKKVYSVLSQAFTMAINENGSVDTWCETPLSSFAYCYPKFIEIMPKYFKNIKTCKFARNCFAEKYKNRFNDTIFTVADRQDGYILPDGTSFYFVITTGDNYTSMWCTKKMITGAYVGTCGYIYVDINGKKGPNVDGEDLFAFKIYQDGIMPMGVQTDKIWVESFKEQCLGKNYYNSRAGSCTAWVTFNENMDYLHCDDLSWEGKKTCK